MTDQQLAERLVALGIGQESSQYDEVIDGFYAIDELSSEYACYGVNDEEPWMEPDDFVRDWRVAGAVMEKTETGEFVRLENGLWAVGIPFPKTNREATAENESLRRAICEAGAEALEQT